jgi:hypothetical protein
MKVCTKTEPNHEGWYNCSGIYYCQYCDGRILDKEYLRKIIEYNTSVKIEDREEVINKELRISLN